MKSGPQTSDLDYHEGGYYDFVTGFLGDMSTSAISDVISDSPFATSLVKVFTLTGMELRRCAAGTTIADAVKGLPNGIYIVGSRKIVVNQ